MPIVKSYANSDSFFRSHEIFINEVELHRLEYGRPLEVLWYTFARQKNKIGQAVTLFQKKMIAEYYLKYVKFYCISEI